MNIAGEHPPGDAALYPRFWHVLKLLRHNAHILGQVNSYLSQDRSDKIVKQTNTNFWVVIASERPFYRPSLYLVKQMHKPHTQRAPKLLIQSFIRHKIGYSRLDGRPAGSVSAKKLSISDRPFLIRRRRKKTCILKGNRAKIYKSTPCEKRAFPSFALFPVGKCVLYTRF